MSAYSDWKCGALNDDEFRSAMARECADTPKSSCKGCVYYHNGNCQVDECYGKVTNLTYGEIVETLKELSYALRDDKPNKIDNVWKNMAIVALENAWEHFDDNFEADDFYEA